MDKKHCSLMKTKRKSIRSPLLTPKIQSTDAGRNTRSSYVPIGTFANEVSLLNNPRNELISFQEQEEGNNFLSADVLEASLT